MLQFLQVQAQEVTLYQQFNGRYDFTIFGNTLNYAPNGLNTLCNISTSSTASLVLSPDDTVVKAYLYWAGSGSGDFELKLNGQDITADRSWNVIQNSSDLIFFSGFKDITNQVIAEGNTTYTLSDLDLTNVILDYCPNGTNFGGWAVIVVYESPTLPINQLNVYDGLDYVSNGHPIELELTSLNVIDNDGAKIGFLAWEGDENLALTESLKFNGTTLSNALNPGFNAFNNTNSFTGSDELYNMDIDVYDIQDLIVPGTDAASIALSSGQDFVIINAIATVLNSQLPDATVSVEDVEVECNSRNIVAHYTIYNLNSTDVLPAATPIAIYANDVFINYTETLAPLAVGESYSDVISLVIPPEVPLEFNLTFVVDDNGSGEGDVLEIDETNNGFNFQVLIPSSPTFNQPAPLYSCNLGSTRAIFDFSAYDDLVRQDASHTVSFHESEDDALNDFNEILNTSTYEASSTPHQIYVRIENSDQCFSVTSFTLNSRNCPPTVYNFVSANNDGRNDTFFIEGLRDIFIHFKLSVYNRWGVLLWNGSNNVADWDGIPTKGLLIDNNPAPDGTYYYVLELNDPGYPEPLTGFLYLNR
ncbi:MAG TPA: gliding motility-associated C-terminal domain-containing protein [Flavobacterium sp.]